MRLGPSGLQDWIVQRLTALVIAAYAIFVMGYLLMHPGLSFETWQALFSTTFMQVATLLTLLCVAWHAWIGMWTITTDYLKCTCLRLPMQAAILIFLFSQVLWGILILWGKS